ncbi:MAG: hypothetical protein H6810_01020 [Phycisphaeraceae bacterium]|nr:MAG: hypothetical protein H6810_01020 [Phycisphaeraceae bacterium]
MIVAALGAVLLAGCSTPSGGAARPQATGTYTFWPLAPDEPRIQFVKSFRSGFDITTQRQSGLENMIFGEERDDISSIEKPYGVAMRKGCLYVCDIRRPSLTALDIKKEQVRLLGTQGANRLAHPVDVDIADDGMIYVADNERNAVVVFGADERYQTAFGVKDWKPVAVAIHGDRLYVCDLGHQQIVIMDRRTGEAISTFGKAGDADGEFRVPLSLDTDKDGFVYVCDMMRCRVQKFTPDGAYLSGVGELGDYAGSFARPKQIAVDGDGILYVVDAAFQNVQMFNDEFGLLMSFGSAGNYGGAMNLPAGLCVSDDSVDAFRDLIHPGFDAYRIIAVTNQFGEQKVSVYALGRRKDGWSIADLHKSSNAKAGVGENARMGDLQSIDQSQPLPEPPAPGNDNGEGGVE